jgi:uncharacterized protein YprB with RNaseH-like and TPR domain
MPMDLKDKLKYYSQTTQSGYKDIDVHPDVFHLAQKLQGRYQDGIIKISRHYAYNQFIPDACEYYPETIFLPTLTKKQFSSVFPLKETILLDLETTGLAGGTGTYPFLIGFGYPGTQGIEIVQYFLPDYGKETGAFLDMKHDHTGKSVLISYNGKSFDYPLLRNRLILNRIDDSLASLAHLDLLHLTRRLWRNSLDNCTLQNIEHKIFNYMRLGDIEGVLIPQAYFNFLRMGNTEDIDRIIHHNQQDILTLVRLLFYMQQIEQDSTGKEITNTELLSLFKLASDSADIKAAQQLYREVKRRALKLPDTMVMAYSALLKRHQCWMEALPFWSGLLAEGSMVPFVCEEFAKYYEHNARDFQTAKTYTERALHYYTVIKELYQPLEKFKEFEHRHQRILSKLQRNG